MALLGIVTTPMSVLIRVTKAVSSVTVPGMLLTMTESPTRSLWVAKTRAPASMPPTKVEIIRPMVIDANPAPVKRACGDTPMVFKTAKPMIRTTIEAMNT